jgi:Domain of unknown function (DUF1772)
MPARTETTRILLWLLVINLGISFGAGIYEARIELPQWLSFTEGAGYVWNAEAARAADTGLRFWVFVTTVPLTLFTLASLIVVWRTQGEVRRWWLIALAAILLDRAMTFGYFIPTMVRLMSGSVPEADAVSMALQWKNLNHIRHIASFTAFVTALKTFAVFYAQQGREFAK